jgi:biopolymer transport protein ExbD
MAIGLTPLIRADGRPGPFCETLAGALDAATQGDKEQRIFVRADRKVPYGEVMETMNLLRSAGYLKIGLVGMEAAEEASPSGSSGSKAPAAQAPAPKP